MTPLPPKDCLTLSVAGLDAPASTAALLPQPQTNDNPATSDDILHTACCRDSDRLLCGNG